MLLLCQYAKNTKHKNEKFSHWVFNFTDAEIAKLQELRSEKGNVKFVLICVKEGFAGSELAIIDYEDAVDCLGLENDIKAYRINSKAYDNKHGLRMYGSGRCDKIDGKDILNYQSSFEVGLKAEQ